MEAVLDLYQQPYDARYPQVCMDETSKQLVGEVLAPLPPAVGQVARQDYEYEHHGTCNLFIAFEPLRPWRHVEVTPRRTAVDWAHFMRDLSEVHYPEAERIRVVLDNLNTHGPWSFYETFPPAEARRLAARFEFHYTPKHGSWLNIAEIELSVLSHMCLDRRISDAETLAREIQAWEAERNAQRVTVDWRFTTDDARIKLKQLYPALLVG